MLTAGEERLSSRRVALRKLAQQAPSNEGTLDSGPKGQKSRRSVGSRGRSQAIDLASDAGHAVLMIGGLDAS